MVDTNTSPHQFIQRLAETRTKPELRNKLRDPLFLLLEAIATGSSAFACSRAAFCEK